MDFRFCSEFNDLGTEDKTLLWSPKLEFKNALGQVQNGVDEVTTVRLVKEETKPMKEDYSLSREG